MADRAHEWTDEEIERLANDLRREYSQAEKEMREKLEKLMADFDEQNRDWQARMAAGKSTRDEYEAWLKDMSMNREFVGGMADTLAQDAVNADKRAMELINDAVPLIYAENANMAAFGIDSVLGQDHSFDLYDQSTVRRLVERRDDPLLPTQLPEAKVDARKDKPWNQRKFNSAVTQSILQGESVPNTAKRLATVLGMDSRAAITTARTVLTSAENAGRVDSYRRAAAMGIKLEQEWLATLDERTRPTHRAVDGEHVPVGEKFHVGASLMEYPADPHGDPSEVYNCRCTLIAWFPDSDQRADRWSDLPDGMTYDEWKSGKEKNPTVGQTNFSYDERRKETRWFQTSKEADDALRDWTGGVWRGATDSQRHAINDYTGGAYAHYNRPLNGYNGASYNPQAFVGVGNADIDQDFFGNTFGDGIREMTEYIQGSVTRQDMWLSRGDGRTSLAPFFGLPAGTDLTRLPEEQLRSYIGTSARIGSFQSCGTTASTGFTYSDITIEFFVPAGSQAAYVEPFSACGYGGRLNWDGVSGQNDYSRELETILQRGGSYTFVDLRYNGDKPIFVMEVHPEDGYWLFQQ